MKSARQMIQDCDALQELEPLTDDWHDMAEADARLLAGRVPLTEAKARK